MAKRRKPWVAAILTLGFPGLGQLYNGKLTKMTLLLVGFPLASIFLFWLMTALPAPPANVLLPLIVILGLLAGTAVDAARDARALRESARPFYTRWYSCLAAWLVHVFLVIPACKAFVAAAPFVQAFKIPTRSMQQTILRGDHVLVDKTAYGLGRERLPARGELIVFRFPEDPRRAFLMRVVGLPGESIEIRLKTVHVDGKALHEPYASFLPEYDGRRLDSVLRIFAS